jgi:hypothetical protein
LNTVKRLVFLPLACALLPHLASAQPRPPPCANDVERQCTGVAAPDLWPCLYAALNDLSPGCQQVVKAISVRSQQGLEVCKGDLYSFCQGVVAGGGAILSCLGDHRADLSPACAAAFGAIVERGKALAQACAAEVPRLCPDAVPGSGQLYLCLSGKFSTLSAGCQAAVSAPGR